MFCSACLCLPNVPKDQPVAKRMKDICLTGLGRRSETAKAIAIDIEQSQSQQKAKRSRVTRERTKVAVTFENPLNQLLTFRSEAQDRQRDRDVIQKPMSATIVEVKRRDADVWIVSKILWRKVGMDHANFAKSVTLQVQSG